MPVRGRMTLGLDAYLEVLQKAEKDVDAIATEVMQESARYSLGTLYHYLRISSETWTGSAARTLFAGPVQRDGNYIFFELGADISVDPAAFYKEYGKPRQAAEPFLRPTLAYWRRTGVMERMKILFDRMGLST
jgi:hypothetical protein